MMRLRGSSENVYSQFGEDGILKEIFDIAGIMWNRAFDCGASDGVTLSNTRRLLEDGWEVCMVEGAEDKFEALIEGLPPLHRSKPYNWVLEPTGLHSIDGILDDLGWGGNIDLLSLDIDGDEYWVLQKMKACPRVICVEFNPTIPLRMKLIGKQGGPYGASLGAIADLLAADYELAEFTHCNGIFVDRDVAEDLRSDGFTLGLGEWDESEGLMVEVSSYVGGYARYGIKPFGRIEEISSDSWEYGCP